MAFVLEAELAQALSSDSGVGAEIRAIVKIGKAEGKPFVLAVAKGVEIPKIFEGAFIVRTLTFECREAPSLCELCEKRIVEWLHLQCEVASRFNRETRH
jgi:hypothetical protein